MQRVTASLGLEAELELDTNSIDFRFLSIYAEDDGDLTSRNTSGHLGLKHWFSPQWFGTLNVDGFKDNFRNLNLRLSIGPALGYQIWNDSKKKFNFQVGLSYFSEDLKTGDDKQYGTARVGSNYQYHFTGNMNLTNNLVVFPNLNSLGDFILRDEVAFIHKVNKHWSFKLTHIFNYNNEPAEGIKSEDFYTIFGLQYNFN